jgi:hypothetical protein
MKWLGTAFLALFIYTFPTDAYPLVLTFDDFSSNPNTIGLVDSISPGYGGLTWGNLVFGNYRDSDNSALYLNTGFQNGAVSDGFIVWPNFGGPISISTISVAFDFNGTYLTSGYHIDMESTVNGYLNDELLYSRTVITNNYTPIWFEFDYYGIDKLEIISANGTLADPFIGRDIQKRYAIIDNFTINQQTPVPEPASILLFGSGVVVLSGYIRKRFRRN